MQNAHDHQFSVLENIVDRIIAVMGDAQSLAQRVATGMRFREGRKRHHCRFHLIKQTGCDGFIGFNRKVRPNFDQIGFGGFR